MMTSDIEKALYGLITWKEFCDKYQLEKQVFFSRKDGISTSCDFNMKFNSKGAVVKKENIERLCYSFDNNDISSDDITFIATAILLSGFEFDDDVTEDRLHFLSNSGECEENIVAEVNAILEQSN